MAEQRTFNPLVQGSTPWRPTQLEPVLGRVNPQIPSCRKPKCASAVPATVVPGGGRARAPDSQPSPSPVQEVCRNSSGTLTAGARRQNPNSAGDARGAVAMRPGPVVPLRGAQRSGPVTGSDPR